MMAAIIWPRLTKSIFEPAILAGGVCTRTLPLRSVSRRTGMHKRQQACVRDCVCYARALMVDARVVTDEHGRVGAARKVEYRACDFGGVAANAVAARARRDAAVPQACRRDGHEDARDANARSCACAVSAGRGSGGSKTRISSL